MSTKATYYTVSDQAVFVGTVALLNSLHVTGNMGELVVLDIGLTPNERDLLERHAGVVTPPREIDAHPWLLKPYPHLLEPSGTVVVIDSDIIVTRSLGDVLGRTEKGKICAFPDPPETRGRWFTEWADVLALRSPLRPDTYVNAGFVAFSVDHWPEFLARWWEACERLPAHQVSSDGPFWAGDQDALNALLMSEVPRDAVAVLPADEVGGDARVVDARALTCTKDGSPVTIIHYAGRPKPWERPGWVRLTGRAYVELLPRLLFASDVPLRLDPAQVPPWLRPGARGELLRRGLGAASRAAATIAGNLPRPVQHRLRVARTRAGGLYSG